MRKVRLLLFSLVLLLSCCDNLNFDINQPINVIVREAGSGTRSAFTQLFDLEIREGDYYRKDITSRTAVVADNTSVVLVNVENNPYSIGYLSLSSVNDSVKTLSIDGVEPTLANLKNGYYRVCRPFNIVVKRDMPDAVRNFIDFISSQEGLKIIEQSGYLPEQIQDDNFLALQTPTYITIGGSSSVAPVMEKLKEGYEKINEHATIALQVSDSTSGVVNTLDYTYDIGMLSREVTKSENDELLSITIAVDALALVVNRSNVISTLSSRQVNSIYSGEVVKWNQING